MTPRQRVVILTGATQGIGRAAAFELARAGCKLALVARRPKPLAELASELTAAGHTAIALPADMGNTAQAAALAGQTAAALGRLDVVINNAAIGLRDNVLDIDEAEHRRMWEVNYFGPVALIRAAIPLFKANPDGGLIINISSIVGRRAMPGIAGYCASKAALEKLAESLRVELRADNIRLSTVYPGVTRTRFNANSLGSDSPGRGRRLGVPPERVARAILSAIRRERRDVFITLFDRAFVTGSAMLPGLMDWLLARRYRR